MTRSSVVVETDVGGDTHTIYCHGAKLVLTTSEAIAMVRYLTYSIEAAIEDGVIKNQIRRLTDAYGEVT